MVHLTNMGTTTLEDVAKILETYLKFSPVVVEDDKGDYKAMHPPELKRAETDDEDGEGFEFDWENMGSEGKTYKGWKHLFS